MINDLKELKALKWCDSYITYVELRSMGLKKEAMKQLDFFFLEFQKQNKYLRREFIEKVNEIGYCSNNYNLYLPVNLYNLFKQEIREWINDEPDNPIPLIWSRDIVLLKRAVEINPENQTALILLGNLIINKISMNQHELSAGFSYSGSQSEDIKLIDFFLHYIDSIVDNAKKNEFTEKLLTLKKQAIDSL